FNFRNSRIWVEGNSLFRVLDADYPGAYFVYNTRNLQNWLRSRAAHKMKASLETPLEFEMRQTKAKDTEDVFKEWTRRRIAFEEDIRRYFANNPRFCEIDIESDQVPERLVALTGINLDKIHWRIIGKTQY